VKKLILLFLLFPLIASAQLLRINTYIFQNPNTYALSTADTIGSITSVDSVEIQMGENGHWKLLTAVISDTAMITADDKVAETAVIFNLAAETWWGHVNEVRFRIYSTGVDTTTSFWVPVYYLRGSLTLDVVPDTIGTATHYSKSVLHGN